MHAYRWLVAAFVLPAMACASREAAPEQETPPDMVLANVTVIDGNGNVPRPGQTIEVRDGMITAVHPSTPDDRSTLHVDSAFVAPGLIDSHVHFDPRDTVAVRARLDSMLRRGVTTIREMACCAPLYATLVRGADSARFPRVYSSALWAGAPFMRDDPRIRHVEGRGTLPWLLSVSDSTDLASALRSARESGATGIKIYSDLAPALVRKIATAARKAGMRVWSHATVFPMRPSEVAAADIDVVSHAALLVWERATKIPAHYDRPHKFNPFGPPAPYRSVAPDDSLVLAVLGTLKTRGVILDPTVTVMREAVGDDAWRWAIALTRSAHALGIPLTVGTDGVSIFDEIETLVDSVGLTPVQAMQAATSTGARAIGVEKTLGAVEAGKVADLVIYRADPTQNVRALRTPVFVIRGGTLVEPPPKTGGKQ